MRSYQFNVHVHICVRIQQKALTIHNKDAREKSWTTIDLHYSFILLPIHIHAQLIMYK